MKRKSDHDLPTSYFLKVRAGGRYFRFRRNFVRTLKNQDWILSVEPQQNKLCFYIDTDDERQFEKSMAYIKKKCSKRGFGDIIYSKIETVTLNRERSFNEEETAKEENSGQAAGAKGFTKR